MSLVSLTPHGIDGPAPAAEQPALELRLDRNREFAIRRDSLYEEAKASMRHGFDTKKLQALQKEYNSLDSAFAGEEIVNGVPRSVMAMLPEIKKVSEEYRLDPYVVSGTACVESFGYQYAIHVGRPKRRKAAELSMGLMQINIKADGIGGEDLKNIFETETNLRLGAKILRECLDRYRNADMAIRAYNKGINRKNSAKIAAQDRYVKDVRRYTKLVRKNDSGQR
jgi:hypothetical protein